MGIIEDDALLAIVPARTLIDLGNHRLDAEGKQFVAQLAFGGVEYLALPGHQVNELGGGLLQLGPGRDDRGAGGITIGNIASRTSLTSYWNERKAHETGVLPISSGYTLGFWRGREVRGQALAL